jgi:hypothetical protein
MQGAQKMLTLKRNGAPAYEPLSRLDFEKNLCADL